MYTSGRAHAYFCLSQSIATSHYYRVIPRLLNYSRYRTHRQYISILPLRSNGTPITRLARVTRLRFLARDDTTFFSLSFSLSSLSLSLSIYIVLSTDHSTLSALHSSGGRLLVSTCDAPLICDCQTKRDSLRSIETTRRSTMSSVSSDSDCSFLFSFFFLSPVLFRHTRARKFFLVFSFLSAPSRFSSQPRHLRLCCVCPCLSFSPSHARTHFAQPHTLFRFLSLSLSLLSRFSFIFRHTRRARRFPLRRSHTRAPLLSLSIMTHTAWEKGCPPVDGQKGFPA